LEDSFRIRFIRGTMLVWKYMVNEDPKLKPAAVNALKNKAFPTRQDMIYKDKELAAIMESLGDASKVPVHEETLRYANSNPNPYNSIFKNDGEDGS
jgi:hypothetical protein